MLRTLYRFALPGGRRVVIAYFPPKPAEKAKRTPAPDPDPLHFDRIFVQAGLYVNVPNPRRMASYSRHNTPVPRGKRVR